MQNLQQFLIQALGGLVFLIVITVLVAVHELGHYWVARLCGMHVNAFAVMMGGRRVTDLSAHLAKPLAPASAVWAMGLFALAMVFAGAFAGVGVLYNVGMAALAIVVPAWIATRLGALYHLELAMVAKTLATCWLGATLLLWYAARGSAIPLNQGLTVFGCASIVALIILYYQPVLKKGEDDDMGEGVLPIDGKDVKVLFRPLVSHQSASGTEFSILMLPVGGFAAIKGMAPKPDGSETQIGGGYYSRQPLYRLATAFAGPLFSVLFGVILFVVLFTTVGQPKPDNRPVLGSVASGGVADKAGLKPGDTILKVAGKDVGSFFDIICAVRERALLPTPIVYRRDGAVNEIVLKPDRDVQPSAVLSSELERTEVKRIQGKVGIGWGTVYVRQSLGPAIKDAFSAPVAMVVGLASIAKQPSKAKEEVGGPGTIAVVAVEATQEGLWMVLLLAAGLSVSFGVMNLLPFPPLDGGLIVVACIELLRRGRRLSLRVQQMIQSGGVLLVIAMMLGIVALDVGRFVGPKDKMTTDQPLPQKKK